MLLIKIKKDVERVRFYCLLAVLNNVSNERNVDINHDGNIYGSHQLSI